jgi:outer membrane lipoprotein-sorting protein
MGRFGSGILVAGLTVLMSFCCTENIDTAKVVEQTRANYEEMEDYRCRFMQTVDSEVGAVEVEGEILAKGDRMRLSLRMPVPSEEEPVEQLVVFDRDVIWTYSTILAAAQKIDLTSLSPDLQQEIRGQYQMRLLVPEFGDVRRVRDSGQFYLIESHEESDVSLPHSRVDYYVGKDDLLVHRIEVFDGDEMVTSVELSEVKLNSGIADAEFAWEPPEGVSVTDVTENMKAVFDR